MKEMIENFNRYQIINESTGSVIKVSDKDGSSVVDCYSDIQTKNAKDCNFICARTKSCGSWSYNGNRYYN